MRCKLTEPVKEIAEQVTDMIPDDALPQLEHEGIELLKQLLKQYLRPLAQGGALTNFEMDLLDDLCASCAEEAESDVSGIAAVYLDDPELAEMLLAYARKVGRNDLELIERARARVTS